MGLMALQRPSDSMAKVLSRMLRRMAGLWKEVQGAGKVQHIDAAYLPEVFFFCFGMLEYAEEAKET